MSSISNINHYYRQAVRSNGIKNVVTSTSALAFYTFQGFQYAATLPFRLSILASMLPLLQIDSVLGLAYEKWQERIYIQKPLHSDPPLGITFRVEFIAYRIFKKSRKFFENALDLTVGSLVQPSLFSIRTLNNVGNCIEDLSTKLSQKALDILGIPVQLSVSQRQLISILKREVICEPDTPKECLFFVLGRKYL